MQTTIQKLAQLYSIAGTHRFLYKDYADQVTLVLLNESGEFEGSSDLTKESARALWDGLVKKGWSTKKIMVA